MKNLLIVNDNTEVDKSFTVTRKGEANFNNIGPTGATEVDGDTTTVNLKRKTINESTEVAKWVVKVGGTFAVFINDIKIPLIFTPDTLATFFRDGNKYKVKFTLMVPPQPPSTVSTFHVENLDFENSVEIRIVKLNADTTIESFENGIVLDSLGTEAGVKLKPSNVVTCFGALSYTGYQSIAGTWDLEVDDIPIVTNANILELRTQLTNLGVKTYAVDMALVELTNESSFEGEELIKMQNTTPNSVRIRLIPNTDADWRLPLFETIGAVTEYTDKFVSICLAPVTPSYSNDENFYTAPIDTTGSPSYYMQSAELTRPDFVLAENVPAWLESKGFKINDSQLIVNTSNERKWLRIETANGTLLTSDGERDDTALSFGDYSKTCMQGFVQQSYLDVPTNYSWDLVDNINLNLTTDQNLRRYLLFVNKLPIGDALNYLSLSEVISLLASKNISAEVIDNNKLFISSKNLVTIPATEIAITAPGNLLSGTFGVSTTNGFLVENQREALLFGFHETLANVELLTTSTYDIPIIIDEDMLTAPEGYLLASSVNGMTTLFKFKMDGLVTLSDLYGKFVDMIDPAYFTLGPADYTETGKLKFTLTVVNIDLLGVLSFQFIGPKNQPILENVLTTEVSTATAINSKYGFIVNADYLA